MSKKFRAIFYCSNCFVAIISLLLTCGSWDEQWQVKTEKVKRGNAHAVLCLIYQTADITFMFLWRKIHGIVVCRMQARIWISQNMYAILHNVTKPTRTNKILRKTIEIFTDYFFAEFFFRSNHDLGTVKFVYFCVKIQSMFTYSWCNTIFKNFLRTHIH